MSKILVNAADELEALDRVVLSAADYHAAIEAHRRRQYVEAVGRFATTDRLELHADSFRVPH
jgi:hypothetical protein